MTPCTSVLPRTPGNSNTVLLQPPISSLRLNAKLAALELERVSGISVRRPSRFPARLRARPQPTPARPQFESVGLVPERFNRHYSRYRAREDRTRLRARVVERNSVSPVSVSPAFSFKFHVQHSQ